jgi:DNA repair protein RecO (recombination protein O)
MTQVATDAIVLHVQDYLESSRIVRLATREHGIQSVLARGARRPRSRFGQSLDLFASGQAQFTMKPGRDMSTLAGFDLTRSRLHLAADLDRFATASAIAEMALRFAHADPHDDAFDVLGSALDDIAAAPPGTSTDFGLAAAWRYIAALGFAPSLENCCVCGSPVGEQSTTPFSHHGGGIVCPRCVGKVSVGRALPSDARRAIASWLRNESPQPLGDLARRAHLRLLREFLQHHMSDGRSLRALDGWEARLRRPA